MRASLSNRPLLDTIVPEDNLRHFLLLLIFGAIMLFVRIFPIYTKIFTDWPGMYGNYVNFSADDAIYHMRFVHNTLHHFPFRVFFDPFTHFPYGSHIAFGPLFTLIIASISLIIGLGHPSAALVNHVAAYISPIMGMLCLVPLYFIARKLFGKTAALLAAAVLSFLPGEFLNRSALGFADHHAAESLFSTTTCALLIYALSATIKPSIDRSKILFYGWFTGIMFGLFILTWQGALMFGAIFLIFLLTQLLINHIKNNDAEYLFSLASLIFIPPAIMILPYTFVNPFTQYPSSNIFPLIAMFAVFAICYWLHLAMQRKQLMRDLYPIALAAVFVLIVLGLNQLFPQLYAAARKGLKMLFYPTPGMRTVSEVRPTIIGYDGKLTIQAFWRNLFWAMPLGIVGLGRLSYRIYKNQQPAEIFLLVWTLVIIAATCAQVRFNYYLAINTALFAGYGIYSILELISSIKFKKKLYLKLQKIIFQTVFFLFIFIIVDPMLMFLMDHAIPSGVQVNREWYNTLIWLKKHTPDPQGKVINKNFNYASGYYPLPKNLDAPYNYPKSAYGVMSWWDVGHQIIYIAERIPNTTPFQLGIIEKDGKSGAASFFTTTDEKTATNNLDKVGSRYIIITNHMIAQFNGIGIWQNNTKGWSKLKEIKTKLNKKTISLKVPIESSKFLHSMINRLFYDDANGLQHFRLIYESDGDYYIKIKRARFKKPQLNVISSDIFLKNYNEALNFTKRVNSIWVSKDQSIFAYSARPPVKAAKIFEKVKGAIISGAFEDNIADDTPAKLMLKLKTKYGRVFTYEQTTKIKNGRYQFIVPYPTTPMKGDGYDYDIKPISNYLIRVNEQITEVSVPEKAVMLGEVCNSTMY